MSKITFDYLSEILGYHTRLYVLLPDCVNEGKEPEGTLYLLHGGGGNGQDWMRYTSIERYAQEREIAVVMPEVDGSCFYSDMKHGYPYYQYLTKEVPRVAESLFPVNRDREKRYVAGLSMGGYGAFKWAFNKPEFFRAAANLSGISFITDIFGEEKGFAHRSLREQESVVELCWGSIEELKGSDSDSRVWIERAAERKERLPGLFAAIGTQDFSYSNAREFLDFCRLKGIPVHYEEMSGGHEWKVWDEMIVHFLDWIGGLKSEIS